MLGKYFHVEDLSLLRILMELFPTEIQPLLNHFEKHDEKIPEDLLSTDIHAEAHFEHSENGKFYTIVFESTSSAKAPFF